MLLKMWQLVCLAYILKLASAENIEIAMSEDENVYMETNVHVHKINTIPVECKANELIKSCEWKWRNISSNSPHAEKWKNTDYSVVKKGKTCSLVIQDFGNQDLYQGSLTDIQYRCELLTEIESTGHLSFWSYREYRESLDFEKCLYIREGLKYSSQFLRYNENARIELYETCNRATKMCTERGSEKEYHIEKELKIYGKWQTDQGVEFMKTKIVAGFQPRNLIVTNVSPMDNYTVVEIQFESSPRPQPHQIKWHIGTSTIFAGEEGKDGFTLYKAGNIEEIEGDLSKVSLFINALIADQLLSLSIFNALSEEPTMLNVKLGEQEDNSVLDIIVYITVCTIVVLLIGGVIYLMRRRKKGCFSARILANDDDENKIGLRPSRNSTMQPLLQNLNNVSLISKTGTPIDFNAFLASQQGTDTQKPLSNYALFQVSPVLGIVVTAQTFNFLAFTSEIGNTFAKLDLAANDLGQSPRRTAKELLAEALHLMITNSNARAFEKLTEVIQYAQNAVSGENEFAHKLSSSRLLLFSQLLKDMYDPADESFIPFGNLASNIKENCFFKIKNRYDQLSPEVENEKNKNLLNNFLKAVYPIISVCKGCTVPTQSLPDPPEFTILPAYLPFGEFNATSLNLGLYTRTGQTDAGFREFLVFLWKEEKKVGKVVSDFVWMRLGQRVFKVPNQSSEEILLCIKEDSKQQRFFKCYYSTKENSDERIRCIDKTELPTGIMPMKKMMAELPTKSEALSEQLVNMNKLGKIYLNEMDIDIDHVNKDGDNLLFLVARHGSLQMLTTLLNIGVDISLGKEPAFLRIAGGTENPKQRAVLKELKAQHKASGTINVADLKGQTALHKAVIGKNKTFVEELIGELDLFIEDLDGKKPKDHANDRPDIKKLIVDMEKAKGFSN